MKKLLIIGMIATLMSLALNSETYAKRESLSEIIQEWQEALKLRHSAKYIPTNFDPFSPFIEELKPAPLEENATVYLSEYNLSQLRLVGIVKMGHQYIAVIEDPKGRGLFLREGDYIGSNKGKIIKITDCAVYIQERYVDFRGRIVTPSKPKILYLVSEEGPCLEN